MFETVVVATDGSEPTERALESAIDLATRFESSLHAVSVVAHGDHRARADAQSTLLAQTAQVACPITRAVRSGPTAETIIEYASTTDADLIVMGVRGRDGPYEYNLGSVTDAVVADSPIPVLTVRGRAN